MSRPVFLNLFIFDDRLFAFKPEHVIWEFKAKIPGPLITSPQLGNNQMRGYLEPQFWRVSLQLGVM